MTSIWSHEAEQRSEPMSAPLSAPHDADSTGRVFAQATALAEIDRGDTRFQHRLFASSEDLIESIRVHGQRTPVHLAGERPPYTVVDGFRRIEALRRLGRDTVLAVVERGATEEELFAFSFAENVRRRSYTAEDKAHAIWQAVQRWRLDKHAVAELLGLSVRQVDRYLALLSFDETLRGAIAAGRISMAHAVVLHRAAPSDAAKWLEEVAASGLSAAELAKRLRPGHRRRGAIALVRDARGFRMRSIRYRHDLSAGEKRRIWDTLEAALRIVAQSSERR
jgi:ParB/RepB/Spo0J family partition protein